MNADKIAIIFFVCFWMIFKIIIQKLSGKIGWVSLLMLPGTFLHELAHFIAAFFMNAKPTGLSIIPKRTDSGLVLGQVTVSNLTFYNALPVAMAPLSIFVLTWIAWNHIKPQEILDIAWMTALAALVCHSAIPSRTDVLVALSKPLGILFYFLLFYAYLRYSYGVKIPFLENLIHL